MVINGSVEFLTFYTLVFVRFSVINVPISLIAYFKTVTDRCPPVLVL